MIATPPGQRPEKRRDAARVIVRANGKVLLMQDTDPGVPGSRWWVTPGGGIDAGETPRQAAVRELREETGLVIDESELAGPVATRDVVHGFSDKILRQHEIFFTLDVDDEFTPDTSGFTEEEKLKMGPSGWFYPTQLAEVEVWPAQLAELMLSEPGACIDLGVMDESTLPL